MEPAISFRVVKEPYGWAVRMGEGMMTPFRSRILAIRHANSFADALRRRGEPVDVVIEETWPIDAGHAGRRDAFRNRRSS